MASARRSRLRLRSGQAVASEKLRGRASEQRERGRGLKVENTTRQDRNKLSHPLWDLLVDPKSLLGGGKVFLDRFGNFHFLHKNHDFYPPEVTQLDIPKLP